MLTVNHYDLIKQKLRDGMSQREVAKKLGHSRNTVAKAVQSLLSFLDFGSWPSLTALSLKPGVTAGMKSLPIRCASACHNLSGWLYSPA